MVSCLELTAGKASLALLPHMGGGIAGLDVADKPVLRPWSGKERDGPFALASNVLVPFSNRISGGGFSFQGQRYDIAPNFVGEQFPIHGDGFQKSWAISTRSENHAILTLDNGGIGPFRYKAEQIFSLTENSLRVDLNLTNTGSFPLPFGCGFHPWFPRNSETRLAFNASGVWLEDDTHLPTTHLELGKNPPWSFAQLRNFPDAGLNNAWTQWTGPACIMQGDEFVSVEVTASSSLDTAIIYTQKSDCNFFCFEPISHPVDAHNNPDIPGLTVLDTAQSTSVWMQLKWNNS